MSVPAQPLVLSDGGQRFWFMGKPYDGHMVCIRLKEEAIVGYLTEQDITLIRERCSLSSLGEDYVKNHIREVEREVGRFVTDCKFGLACSKFTLWMHHGIQDLQGGDDGIPRELNSTRRVIGIGALGTDIEGEVVLGSEQENPKPSYHWLRELTEVEIAIAMRDHKEALEDDPEYAEYCQRTGQTLSPWGDNELVLLRKWLYETTPYTIWHMHEKCRYVMEDYLYADGLFTEIATGFEENVRSMTDAVKGQRDRQMKQWMEANSVQTS